jgi:hypothetical protein
MNGILERRVVKLESGKGPRGEFSHLNMSEMLMLTAAIAAEDPEGSAETAALLDEQERSRAAFEERQDVREAIERNIAAGHCPPQEPLDKGFRWPRLLRHHQWHERQYPR